VYPRTARDIGRIVYSDEIYSILFRATQILLRLNLIKGNAYGPYASSNRTAGFATFGPGHILDHISRAATVIRDAWYQKWNVHRLVRPEAYAGLVHFTLLGNRTYPLPADLLQNPVLDQIYAYNAEQNQRLPTNDSEYGVGTYLLPQMPAVGCPNHPSYPAAHSVIAGVGASVLKAWWSSVCDLPWPSPQVPSDDGQTLQQYTGSANLTICGEINKLAYSMAHAREMIGVHWRSDSEEGLLLGEAAAVRMMQEDANLMAEPFAGFQLRKFDGTLINVMQKNTQPST